jgi:hypothetical protein
MAGIVDDDGSHTNNMGITIHYHGKISQLDRVAEFEDRVVDMALEIGAAVRIWRSSSDQDPLRIVRGLILDVSPGQEPTSLLISPEGWLIPLHEIEAAETGALAEPPHCSVKTQFGSVEGHVAVVTLLTFLKQEFFPTLVVSDESGYWENRDVERLVEKFTSLRAAIDRLSEGLRSSPLSAEAAADPEIVAKRVERIARQVHQSLARPPEHPPVSFDDDALDWNELDEAHWDAAYKEQRRKQERLHRAMEEELRTGTDHTAAFENAMRNEGIIDWTDELDAENFVGEAKSFEAEPADESWRESLPPNSVSDEDPLENFERESHPLQQLASDLHVRIFKLFEDTTESRSGHIGTLTHGVGEIGGGLAQALMDRDTALDSLARGLALVQLKRALRGAAFAKGALYALRAEALLSQDNFNDLLGTLQQLEDGIVGELIRIREPRQP